MLAHAQLLALGLLFLFLGSTQARDAAARAVGVDFMKGYVASRMAVASRQQAERRAVFERTARMARSIAQGSSWVGEPVERPRQVRYVDLSRFRPMRDPKAITASFEASGASYPRYPKLGLPPPVSLITSCPDSRSVMQFAAAGDGVANDGDAITAADSLLDFIYFPPGIYRVSTSIQVDKPIVVGKGAKIIVDDGITLTLTSRPRHWDISGTMFAGPGKVVLAGVDEVHPDWFKAEGVGDSQALQKAIDSCSATCTVVLSRLYRLNSAVYLRPAVGIVSTGGGYLYGRDGTGEGLVLQPGTYTQPLQIGTLFYFSEFNIKIVGGVSGAEIQLATLAIGGTGIVFSPDEGQGGAISDVYVTHLTATTEIQNTIEFRGSGPGQALNHCLVRCNFVVHGGFQNPSQQSAGLHITGAVAPTLVDTSVLFQAVDPLQSIEKPTQFALVQNTAGTPADSVVYQVETWAGNIWGAGKMVTGEFNGLKFLTRSAGGIPSAANLWPTLSGEQNLVSFGAVTSAGIEHVMAASPSLAAFGQPLIDQVFYLRAPITTNWRAGEVRTFYFYAAFAKTTTEKSLIRNRQLECIAFRAYNLGIVCAGLENQDNLEDGRVAIKLRNASKRTIPMRRMPSFRIGVQLGP